MSDTHPGIITSRFAAWLQRRHSWIPRGMIHVRSETEKKIVSQKTQPANGLESDSLEKFTIHLDWWGSRASRFEQSESIPYSGQWVNLCNLD